jgi:HEAT repeat protein
MPDAPSISIRELRGYIADAAELAKGTQIADGGLLLNLSRYENRIFGEAKGSGQSPYRVSLIFAEQPGSVTARCSCMAARSRPFCKHSAALLVAWARSPEAFVVGEAPPAAVGDGTARKKSVKAGKASGSDLMKQGVERVTTLVRELAVAGIAAAGSDRVDQIRQLGEALRENRLRRLSARTLELAGMTAAAIDRRRPVDAVAYADLLSDMLLTARRLEKHLAGQTLEDRYVEELIGKTWRKDDRTPVAAVDLAEYTFTMRVTPDDFVIRESRFVDLRTGVHYAEKQILPSFLAKRTAPKRSYAGHVLLAASGGVYPGFPPHRIDLEVAADPLPITAQQVAALVEQAYPNVGAALAAFQEHRKDVFAPDAFPVSVRVEIAAADGGRFRAADANGEALHLSDDPRLEEAMSIALRRGRLRAILGEMTIDGILATLTPFALAIETAAGFDLTSLEAPPVRPSTRRSPAPATDLGPRWLEQARRAGVSPAAVALGEVRLELADALMTGLGGLVPRVTDPLTARLIDLGLDKPAAVLGELPSKDPADRLEGFVKVHQIAGLALVRMAGTTTIDSGALERLPGAESIAIRRPAAVLTAEELLIARLDGTLTRHEAAWHRAKQLEAISVEEWITEWPRTWSDGEAAPHIARVLVPCGQRAVNAAGFVLADPAAGLTAQLTAIQVLTAVGGDAALNLVESAVMSHRLTMAVRALAATAANGNAQRWGRETIVAGWDPKTPPNVMRDIESAADKETRLLAIGSLEGVGTPEAIASLRRAWTSDPVAEVRARAATMLGYLGDSDALEMLLSALRDRASAVAEAKGALAGLAHLGDVRAVTDILQALTENWAGPLPMEALQKTGIAALEPIMALAIARPDLASRKSLQSIVEHLSSSPQALRILLKRLDELLDAPGHAEKAHALLRLTADSEPLREALAARIVERLAAPADKAEKALVRAAQQAQGKNSLRTSA